jgi:hypothetical protein
MNHLFEALDNQILIVRDSVPLCPWNASSQQAAFGLSISDLKIVEQRATVYVGLGCAYRYRRDTFAWVLEYKLEKSHGRWLVTAVTEIMIT